MLSLYAFSKSGNEKETHYASFSVPNGLKGLTYIVNRSRVTISVNLTEKICGKRGELESIGTRL